MTSFYSRKYFRELAEEGTYIRFHTEVQGLEIYYHPSQLRVHVFTGRQKKPSSFLYPDEVKMIMAIDSIVSNTYDKHVQKMERKAHEKALAEEARKNVRVGDIFATSWGYDRTIVDFFEVVERVSNAYVNVRAIKSEMVSGDHWSGSVKPVPGAYESEPKKCQINMHGHIVKADEYGHTAYKTTADSTHHVSCD